MALRLNVGLQAGALCPCPCVFSLVCVRKRRVWQRTLCDSSVLWERKEVERIIPPAMWVIAPRLPRVGWRDVLSAGLRWHWHPQVLEWCIANSIGKDKRFCSRTHVPAYVGERMLSCGIIFMCPKCACVRVSSLRPAARVAAQPEGGGW